MTEGDASHDILSDKMAGHEWLRRMILVVLALMLAGFGARPSVRGTGASLGLRCC